MPGVNESSPRVNQPQKQIADKIEHSTTKKKSSAVRASSVEIVTLPMRKPYPKNSGLDLL